MTTEPVTTAEAIAELTGLAENASTEAELNAGFIDNLQRGFLEVVGRNPETGELQFRLTEAGKRRVKSMGISEDPS